MTSRIFVGCSTGRSDGLAPFRTLSTYIAACRPACGRSGPYAMRFPSTTKSSQLAESLKECLPHAPPGLGRGGAPEQADPVDLRGRLRFGEKRAEGQAEGAHQPRAPIHHPGFSTIFQYASFRTTFPSRNS